MELTADWLAPYTTAVKPPTTVLVGYLFLYRKPC